MGNYIGILGIALILLTAYVWSDNRKMISWRLVGTILVLAFLLGELLLKVPGTSDVALLAGTAANKLSDFAMEGASFVFGDTITYGKFFHAGQEHQQQEFVFAVRIGLTITFICGLCAIGYYLRILQKIVVGLGLALQRLGLGGAEAVSFGASLWVGQVEAQLLIKKYLPNLTRSELFASMTNSMAVAAGSALVLYMSLGVNSQFLITASVMSALTSIALAKIIMPETQFDQLKRSVDVEVEEASGFFDAAEKGVMQGLRIAASVVVMVAFAIAFIAMLNAGLEKVLGTFGMHATIKDLLAYPFTPVAYLIGVPWHEAALSGRLIGTEISYNEVVSYFDFVQAAKDGLLSPRTQAIMTCALCGFAHPGSIAIQIGGLGAMAPNRRAEIAKYALKAMIVANMATWVTAAMVSLIY